MNHTGTAAGLDSVFSRFDFLILSSLHSFAERTGGHFTLPLEIISLLFEKGLVLVLAGLVLFILKKTRKTGFILLAAVVGSSIITLLLKDHRPAPAVY